MSQPSLKITHFEKRQPPRGLRLRSLESALGAGYERPRVAGRRHGARSAPWHNRSASYGFRRTSRSLASRAPPAPPSDGTEFAEVRITAQAQRHYDVRSFDSPEWTHFRGYISQATEQICGEVGYVLAPALVPAPPKARLQAKSA